MARNRALTGCRIKRTALTWAGAVLLLATLLAAIGAGPDEPRLSTAADDNWQIFEGHAFADGRIVPHGISLVACLGGCAAGHVSPPVTVEADGRYRNLKVAPGPASRRSLPDSDLITFWLVGDDASVGAGDGASVPAVQSWLFAGNGQTQKLHLSFKNVPLTIRGLPGAPLAGVTTDLTIPAATELGLVSGGSARAYANSVRYGGLPLLPGFVVALGLLLCAGGISLLLYRRRLTW